MPQIVAKLEGIVKELDTPPILIGHSAGSVFVQLLLDRGYGAVWAEQHASARVSVPR